MLEWLKQDRSAKMITITQIVGTSLSNLSVDEDTFVTQSQLGFEMFAYDGADWSALSHTGTVDLTDYGITFTGTPATDDVIGVSQTQIFSAGKGINCIKLNQNFADMQNKSNTNETQINNIATNSLKTDGSNITQDIVDAFNTITPTVLTNQSGTITLQDNTQYYISLSGNATLGTMPVVGSDNISHTIIVVIEPNNNSFDISIVGRSLGSGITINTAYAYQIMFIFNKIDGYWYYCIGQ